MKKPVILYVDDEPDALKVLAIELEERGFSVLTCGGGSEALELLRTNAPDLIIADLRMRPMTGFDLLQQVKKLPKFATTPFLFHTAVDDYLAEKYGQKLGVDAYLTKPVDLDKLETVIRNKIKAG